MLLTGRIMLYNLKLQVIPFRLCLDFEIRVVVGAVMVVDQIAIFLRPHVIILQRIGVNHTRFVPALLVPQLDAALDGTVPQVIQTVQMTNLHPAVHAICQETHTQQNTYSQRCRHCPGLGFAEAEYILHPLLHVTLAEGKRCSSHDSPACCQVQ